MNRNTIFLLFILVGISACSRVYEPNKIYTQDQLKKDFWVMKNSLENSHPSLYWYSPKDSIDLTFNNTLKFINKPMTVVEFMHVLEHSIEPIKCGHTGVFFPVSAYKYRKKYSPNRFPLRVGYYQNKLYVLSNNSKDSTVKKGMELVSIDGRTAQAVYDTIFRFINSDGYNQTFKNIEAQSSFDSFYRYWFGEKEAYSVILRDSTNQEKTFLLTNRTNNKNANTINKSQLNNTVKVSERLVGNESINLRLWEKDTTIAILSQKNFNQNHYKSTYAKCFEAIKTHNIRHLVIDTRGNGGGNIASVQNLLSYLLDSTFVTNTDTDALPWRPNSNFKNRLVTGIFLKFSAKKKVNGHLTAKIATKKINPSKQNHYDGKLYVLTNGGSFSAASIFPAIIQARRRGVIIGRETGGGAFGCTAGVLPYVTLPETKISVRIPLFRFYNAINTHTNFGHGVMPEYMINYTLADVLQNKDLDLQKVGMLKKENK
jgi:C-terminal processing protease CtpA/Prc